jgi:hypothetical protein
MTAARSPIGRVLVCQLGVWLCLACVLAATASGRVPARVQQQASSGDLHAVLSFLQRSSTQSYVLNGKTQHFTTTQDSGFRISLTRLGALLFSRGIDCADCQPAGLEAERPTPSVHFARLDPSGDPALLVDLYTGGAHCCFLTDLVLTSGSHVRLVRELWGDSGYRLVDLDHDGQLEFLTADDRFAYAFTAYAGSLLPIKILRLVGSRLDDVTRSYPAQVAADAASAWATYRSTRTSQEDDERGVLGAWAADEALLARWPAAEHALDQALAQGDLSRVKALPGWPTGGAYLTALRRFLTRLGYL